MRQEMMEGQMDQRTSYPVGLATVAALALALTACTDLVAPTRRATVDTLEVTGSDTADGFSLNRVVVTVDTTLPPSARAVTVNTTFGTFVFGGKQTVTLFPDSTGTATTYLQAPQDSCTALLWATVGTAGGVAVTRQFTYVRAPIDSIALAVDSFALFVDSNQVTKVTARLWRHVGKPSPHARLWFRAIGTDSKPHGQFTAAPPSDSTEQVVVLFTAADTVGATKYYGPLTIKAFDWNDTTKVLGWAQLLAR
jgi:hypothetical protein